MCRHRVGRDNSFRWCRRRATVKARAALEQAKELGRVNEGKGMGAGDPKEGLYTKTTQCIIVY